MSKTSICLISLLLYTGIINSSSADIIVIANQDFSINSISNKKLKKLWLGKTKKISGLGRVFISDQNHDNNTAKIFYKQIINKSPKQVKAYWAKLQFIGKGFPPKRFTDDAAIMEWVSNGKNRIGYIDEKSMTDGFIIINRLAGDSK